MSNLVVNLPYLRHGDHGDPADGAGVVAVGQHVVEAVLVDQVVARRDLRRDSKQTILKDFISLTSVLCWFLAHITKQLHGVTSR